MGKGGNRTEKLPALSIEGGGRGGLRLTGVCFRLLQVDSDLCYSNFESTSLDVDLWVLGDVFLRLYFTVFDREKDRIGLAPVASE